MQYKDLTKLIPLLEGIKRGQILQFTTDKDCYNPVWIDATDLDVDFVYPIENYRLKPDTHVFLRPWKPSLTEIPVGAMYRKKGVTDYCSMIVGFTPKGVTTIANIAAQEEDYSFEEMLKKFEWSKDGKTWYPCGLL